MDGFLHLIHRYHREFVSVHDATIRRLDSSVPEVLNPLYEVEAPIEDRIGLEIPVHDGICCDGSQCRGSEETEEFISGLRYCCVDCPPGNTDFCSSCVRLDGQGVYHDISHRLVQLSPSICALCEDVMRLKLRDGDMFRGPYREFSASVATFQRVVRSQSCAFCAFVWSALAQSPPIDKWPPNNDENVTIRLRRPWRNCLKVSVVTASHSSKEIEIGGGKYISETANIADMEKDLEIYIGMKSSHQRRSGIGPSDEQSIIGNVQRTSGSNEALQIGRMWLKNCRENHPQCADSGPGSTFSRLPKRLIDLQGQDRSRVYLCVTDQIQSEYAALSYCWGPGSPGLFTTKGNFQSYRDEGIAIEDLPLTIRDTIHATRELGLRYLWIDRLCIVQDSQVDWSHQAALMCDVYAGAALTLSADGSSSAAEGLFHDQALSDLKYQAYQDSQGNESPFLLLRPISHPNLELRTSNNSQPIDQRGWTMQERLMSRRVLHFTADELTWECNTLTECECRRQSDRSIRALAPHRMGDMESVYEQWRMLVVKYTKRSLSHETDKLPAFRGLVARFHQIMAKVMSDGNQDEYLAGLWRGDLVAQLAWKPPSKADLEAFTKTIHYEKTRQDSLQGQVDAREWIDVLRERNKRENWHQSKGYMAPTWSWAHLHGPISYLFCNPSLPFKSYVEILEAQAVPSIAGEQTGRVASGFITLCGPMVRDMDLDIMHCGYEDNTVKDLSVLSYGDGEFWVEFEPDDVQSIVRERGCDPRGLVLLLLGTKDWMAIDNASVVGVSSPVRIERSPKLADHSSEAEAVAATLPEVLVEAFYQDQKLIRWSSYLVLAESKTYPGKYERLGCFDVWGPQVQVMADLFVHSVRSEVTIL